MGKIKKNGIYRQAFADIWTKVLQKCSLSSILSATYVLVDLGHMTKMVATPIIGQKSSKNHYFFKVQVAGFQISIAKATNLISIHITLNRKLMEVRQKHLK